MRGSSTSSGHVHSSLRGSRVLLVCAIAALTAACPSEPTTPAAAPPPPPRVEAPKPAAADASVEERKAVVASVSGPVERLHAGSWTALQAGDTLRPREPVRAGSRGRADLDMGGGGKITVHEQTELLLEESDDSHQRLRVERGRLSVAYPENDPRVLQIEGAGGAALAEARGARFSVLATGASFAVATETGTVNLKASGTTVAVRAGEQSTARTGEAPTAAAPLPTSLLLKVARGARQSDPCANVEGSAPAGAEVLVDGVATPVDPDGRFRARPAAGRARVKVVIRDVAGRTREETIECLRVERPAPINEMKIRWKD